MILFLFLYWLNKGQPQTYTWKPTYDTEDKQPYGAYALDKLLKASWKNEYTHCYQSISDLKELGSLDGSNLLIVTEVLNTTDSDIDTLFEYIREGGTALIVARHFYVTYLTKKLNFSVGYEPFSDISLLFNDKKQYNTLRFCARGLDDKKYKVPDKLCSGFFNLGKIKDSAFIAAKSNDSAIVMLRYQIGKGSLLLSCNPLIYTNYGVLNDSMNMFIWNSFAYLQGKPLIRTEYYHAGSNAKESRSPLRYLMSKKSLKWALNITIVTILIFMIFTAKRKQKAIPIVKPPKNRMLGFVRSVAGLYIRKNNNADIILKKQIYLADKLKRNYGIDIINETHDDEFYRRLSYKTGKPIVELSYLFRYLDSIDKNTHVSDAQMMEIITQMNGIK